jgi:hypothetical protein
VKLSLGLGQHPAPDETFSFYAVTPSGFDFDVGAAGKEIELEGWQERHWRSRAPGVTRRHWASGYAPSGG